MTDQEAQDWFAGEIYELLQMTKLRPLQEEMLEAYLKAEEALRTAEANSVRPYWFGKM
jgi:hypothetical protein